MKNIFGRLFSSSRARVQSKRTIAPRRAGVRRFLEDLEDRLLMHGAPTLAEIMDITLPAGQTFNVPLDGGQSAGEPLTFTATSSNASVTVTPTSGNTSLRISASVLVPFTALAATDEFTAGGHNFVNGTRLRLMDESLPGGFSEGTTYFVRDVTATTFRLATTVDGAAVDVTSDGDGDAFTEQTQDMIFQLFVDLTPDTVAAITNLVAAGFYTRASLTTAFSGANNDLFFTAVNDGVPGTRVTIEFFEQAGVNMPLGLAVTGNAIRVNLAKDANGNLSTTNTAAAIRDLFMNDQSAAGAAARALVNVTLNEGTGAGVVQSFGPSNLTQRTFHRIIPDFVAQLGNDQVGAFPNTGTLVGISPVALNALDDEYARTLTFTGFGQLAMAKVAADDSGTGQFFITDADLSVAGILPPRHLNFDHTIFGQLTEGISALVSVINAGTFAFTADATTNVFTAPGHVFINDSALLPQTVRFEGSSLPGGITAGTTFFVRDVVGSTFRVSATRGGAAIDISSNGSGNVQDTTGDHHREVVVTGASTFVDQFNGVLRVAAPDGFTGTSMITVTAADGEGGTVQRQFDVTVVADTVNDKPFLGPIAPQATTINTPITFTIPFVDLEAADAHTFAVGSAANFLSGGTLVNQPDPANANVSLNTSTGQLTVTPINNFSGTLRMTIGVRDASHGSTADAFDTQQIEVQVAANNAPIATPQTLTVFQNTENRITLTGEDGDDPAVQTLTFRIETAPANGTLLTTGGTEITVGTNLTSPIIVYRPDDGFTGPDSFTFTVLDNGDTVGGGQNEDVTDATVMLDVVVPGPNPAITLRSGMLRVVGGMEDNDISFDLNDDGDQVFVTKDNDPVQSFPLASVQVIQARGDGGDDTITVAEDIELPAMLFGDAGDDILTGGGGADVIRGGRGDDEMDGGGGDDLILGGLGDDDMTGGPGNDLMRGGPRGLIDLSQLTADGEIKSDDDVMDGGDGDDLLFGGMGSDEMNGGEGNDRLMGDPRPNFLDPLFQDAADDFGDDTLRGDDGDDVLWGFIGDDELEGGDGIDKLHAGLGADALLGGAGVDALLGGPGIDDFDMNDDDEFDDSLRDVRRRREIVTGDFRDTRLMGVRTFELPGAPGIDGPNDSAHVNTLTDDFYVTNGFTNPPTYGQHRFASADADHPNGAPVQPTGVFTTSLFDVDLVHNLEHGHVVITYDPVNTPAGEIEQLERIVRSFGDRGTGVGIVLAPRAANDDAMPIALASWGHLMQLATVDRAAVAAFIKTNRGHSPEGFETP